MYANSWVYLHYGPKVVYVYLYNTLSHYPHFKDLSESIGYKEFYRLYLAECMFLIKSILPNAFCALYTAVWFQPTHFDFDDCENFSTSSYYQRQIGNNESIAIVCG